MILFMLRCDLHVHTSFSRDGESSVGDVLARAKAARLDAIAITDHDSCEGIGVAERAGSGLVIIPGVEVSTKQGHLLVLGVREPLPAGLHVMETIRLARSRGAVTILPHPYHMWRHGVARRVPESIGAVDGIEVFNSRYIVGSANRKAARVSRKVRITPVGGSDAHNARFVGFGYTLIAAEPEVSSILSAIRDGKTIAGGKMTPLRTYSRQSLRNALRRVRRRVRP
ncbi:MAG TPA: PHP domain-containing protein [Methanomicrobiales archaeon]|jgi:predicted metal-dependent phosphoesterase TrpH|nr:PHP domain-containing protein [Methanomicrobiales archaeon]